MYCEQLNQKLVERLKTAVEGKRVLLVGNALSLFSSPEHGKIIDSYDFVLRFGKGATHPYFAEFMGTKTDAWFCGFARASGWKNFKDVKWKIVSMGQLQLYTNNPNILVPKFMADGRFQYYRDFMWAGDIRYLKKLSVQINGETAGGRVSQGAHCAAWFHDKVSTYKSLDLIGFDFFETGVTYNYNAENKKSIPVIQPTTSWHCPLVSKEYDENPHGVLDENGKSNEEKFIRAIPGIYIHPMPKEIDIAHAESIIRKFRGDQITNIRIGAK